MSEIAMPRLSDSMEQGTILTWLKTDGDHVAEGEDLVEIETDKATMTYPSPGQGVLSILAAEGSTLAVGAPIAGLAADAAAATSAADGRAAADLSDRPWSGVEREVRSSPSALEAGLVATHPANGGAATADVNATPVAKRLARIHGVDIASLHGSGPRGRVMRRDVAAAAGVRLDAAAPATAARDRAAMGVAAPEGAATASIAISSPPMAMPSEPVSPASERTTGPTMRELTRMQQVVARRMSQAQATVPDFQVETEVTMDAAVRLRAELKDAAIGQDVVPSVNDLIVKACALALRSHPLANASYHEDGFELHDRINVGIAVAAEHALLVPTITEADSLSLGSIAVEARRLSESARNGSILPSELSGATFTVSNLGMFGMTAIKPVVNMPQAAILGVGALRSVLARGGEGEIVDRSLLTLTLSCDHRILYGADAARFLADVRALLEAPMRLVL
jgi:pyruvate dehydrogenase E2 component (dihydrolipoamide acetyltransferase)